MSNLHAKIIKNDSPFRHMVMAAWVIGVGDVLCVLGDLYWLYGDMTVQIHPHHYIVATVLILAAIMILGSFIWLYTGVNRYLARHEHVHTKHERLTVEIQLLKDKVELLEFKLNVNRADTLAGVKDE